MKSLRKEYVEEERLGSIAISEPSTPERRDGKKKTTKKILEH